jgi:hypothetical protein
LHRRVHGIYRIIGDRRAKAIQINKAINIVRSSGTAFQNARLDFIFGESDDTSTIERFLTKLELSEGGFPYQHKPQNPYCLSPTSMIMKIMAETKLTKASVCKRTIAFVKDIQHTDGYWDENPALLSFDPPSWDRPGDKMTQLWLTGALADHLIRLGEGSSTSVKKARGFLLRHRREDGRVEGPLINTWLTIAVIAPDSGIDDPIIQKSLTHIGQNRDWEPTELAWALECLFYAAFPRENSIVSKLLDTIVKLQSDDGYWISSDDPLDLVRTTLECLIILHHYKRI